MKIVRADANYLYAVLTEHPEFFKCERNEDNCFSIKTISQNSKFTLSYIQLIADYDSRFVVSKDYRTVKLL